MWSAYAKPTGSITAAIERLRQHISEVPHQLVSFSETELTQHAPEKWSRKEILGHLIDSAINNLKRFTDTQAIDGPYLLQPYNQNNLVVVNQYQNLPLSHLLTLWSGLNTQIIYVAEAIPSAGLKQTVRFADPASDNQTMGWLIEDYVAHLEHHLKSL